MAAEKEIVIQKIRDVPDFPKKGILFKDITPVLADAAAFSAAVDWFAAVIEKAGSCDLIAGIESRGFIFGAAIAQKLQKGLILVRKPGKLPSNTHKIEYELEYGIDTLEIHTDAVHQGQKVAIVDDLLATGGTAAAAFKLLELCGAHVTSVSFLIELAFLNGRDALVENKARNIQSLIEY